MVNYDKLIVTSLQETGLKVFYELFCDANTPKPCITYNISNDSQEETGDTLGYSRIQYYIKVWADDLSVINPYCISVDNIMRALGFKRVSTNTLTVDTQICKIFLYECVSQENFN